MVKKFVIGLSLLVFLVGCNTPNQNTKESVDTPNKSADYSSYGLQEVVKVDLVTTYVQKSSIRRDSNNVQAVTFWITNDFYASHSDLQQFDCSERTITTLRTYSLDPQLNSEVNLPPSTNLKDGSFGQQMLDAVCKLAGI